MDMRKPMSIEFLQRPFRGGASQQNSPLRRRRIRIRIRSLLGNRRFDLEKREVYPAPLAVISFLGRADSPEVTQVSFGDRPVGPGQHFPSFELHLQVIGNERNDGKRFMVREQVQTEQETHFETIHPKKAGSSGR